MIEIDGVKVFEGSDIFREVKAREEHICDLCGQRIEKEEKYYRYIEKQTGGERKACLRHVNTEIISQFKNRRKEYVEKRERREGIVLETDASGPEGERWAFIVYLNGEEFYRDHGYTPRQINDITPAEAYAVLMAIKWLSEEERRGKIETNLPVSIGSDNYAVLKKLDTQSERGKYRNHWHELMQALLPYRREGRLFIGLQDYSTADRYASKDAFEPE